MNTPETPKFVRSMYKGWYISTDDRYSAELRPAGHYPEFGCKLTRHYALRLAGSDTIQATVPTLKGANALLVALS
jgi:hypothetical protein